MAHLAWRHVICWKTATAHGIVPMETNTGTHVSASAVWCCASFGIGCVLRHSWNRQPCHLHRQIKPPEARRTTGARSCVKVVSTAISRRAFEGEWLRLASCVELLVLQELICPLALCLPSTAAGAIGIKPTSTQCIVSVPRRQKCSLSCCEWCRREGHNDQGTSAATFAGLYSTRHATRAWQNPALDYTTRGSAQEPSSQRR